MSEESLPQFAALYAVSDLHMGGLPGFQIFNRGERLGRLIRQLADERPDDRLALVLNGDVIDSLAEQSDGYIVYADVEKMLSRMYADPAFGPVWTALAEFVSKPRRTLVIVIGNHDIEMALPAVERSMRMRLTNGNESAQGRIVFATHGAGFACTVGPARVFCTHGNEVDSWNLVDYRALSDLGFQHNAGMRLDPGQWTPNGGTRLVKDVMNDIKSHHPWIDLLKPETHAALGVLLVMDPNQLDKIRSAVPVVWDKLRGELVMRGWLSAEGEPTNHPLVEDITLHHLLGPNLLDNVRPQSSDADSLLRVAEKNLRAGKLLAEQPPAEATLGLGQMLWDRLRGVDEVEALRRALQDWLANDRSFVLTDRDSTFTNVMKRVGPGVDFVVTGHTHLHRAIRDGTRTYYNCGTWIRLLRFTDEVLQDRAAFKDTYEVLTSGKMADLDAATVPGRGGYEPLVLDDRSTLVRIAQEDGSVVGGLFSVVEDGASVRRVPVAGSEFRRG